MALKNGRNNYHLICINDDPAFLAVLRMLLSTAFPLESSDFDLELHFVDSPDKGGELITKLTADNKQIAMIICDQKVSTMAGVKFIEHIRNTAPQAVKVLLTGQPSLRSAKYAINRQLLDMYVSKPILDYSNFISNINNLLNNFHLSREKEISDRIIKDKYLELEKANHKIVTMHKAAEEIAHLARGLRKLNLDEVLDFVIKRIPPIFRAQYASLFLYNAPYNTLHLARSNFLQHRYTQPFNRGHITPMNIALAENKTIIIPDISREPYQFLKKENRGKSCIIIPFILDQEDTGGIIKIKEVLYNLKELPVENIDKIQGVLNLSKIPRLDNLEVARYKANLIKDIIAVNILNAQLYQQTQQLALTDKLTGIYNKYIFLEFLKKECAVCQRKKSAFYLAISDIDNFKKINDTFGHRIGDEVLRKLGGMLRVQVRKSDVAARFGGEEFAFIIREKNPKKALSFLERIRSNIAAQTYSKNIKLTMSFGLAAFSPSQKDCCENIIDRADNALYKAKNGGKNRVELYE